MRALALLLLLSCTNKTSKERVRPEVTSQADCLRETGKYSDLTFCVDERTLLICNPERCLRVPLDAIRP